MATLEPLDIIVKVQQKEELEKLTRQAELATGEIVKLNKQLQAGTLNQAQFNAAAQGYATTVANLVPQIKALEGAQAGMGRGLGQLAYAVDDIQYGFNAIVNNIPQIVLGLGGSMGLAGAIGIAAVAVNQLSKHWNELFGSPEWTSVEERAKAGADAFKEMANAINDVAEATAKAFGKTAGNIPGGAGGLAASAAGAMATGGHMGPHQRSWTEAIAGFIGGRAGERMVTPSKGSLTAGDAEALIGRAKGGDAAAISDLQRLVAEQPGMFTEDQQRAIMNPNAAQDAQGARKGRDAAREAQNKDEAAIKDQIRKEVAAKQHGIAEGKRLAIQRAHDEDAEEKKVFEAGKRRRLDALQDQAEALHEKEHQIRLAAQMNKSGGGAYFDSTKAMLMDIRQGAFEQGNNVPKQQLQKLEAIHQELVKNGEAMKKERRAVFQ